MSRQFGIGVFKCGQSSSWFYNTSILHLKKNKDILIILFAILVVSALVFGIIAVLVIQDKYDG